MPLSKSVVVNEFEKELIELTATYQVKLDAIKAKYEDGIKAIDAKYPRRSYVATGFQGITTGFLIGFSLALLLLINQ